MSAQRDSERYASELTALRRQIASASSDVAAARKSEASARSQASRTNSASSAQSKLRDAERYGDKAVNAEKRRADLESKAAQKEKNMYDARARADKERDQQQVKRDRDRDQAQRTSMDQLQRRLAANETSARTAPGRAWSVAPNTNTPESPKSFDVFISHASEDKDEIARPLYLALTERGLSVWFDEATLTVGDSLRRKIDEGLRTSTFGVVVLSPNFFAKEWPQAELDALHDRQMTGADKVILPIWHKISKDEIAANVPMLAGTLGLQSALMSVAEMAVEIDNVVQSRRAQVAPPEQDSQPLDESRNTEL